MSGEFKSNHGIYHSEWGGPTFVRIDIDHLHQSSRDGEITGEVRVNSTSTQGGGLIHQARFTLTGTRSRSDLARHCATRTPGQDLDWVGLIEWASVKTIGAFRAGELPTYINEAPKPQDDGYLIAPLVIGRLPTIWFGEGGVAKSLLALAAGISIQTGHNVLGSTPPAQRNVAILDWEMDAWEHRKRLEALCAPLGIAPPTILHVPCRAAIWDDTERLRRIIAEHQIGFVVVDSVGMACGGVPLVSDEAAIRFNTALRQLEVGSLCIAHRSKAEDGDRYPFGSAFWFNQARLIWFVRKAQEAGEGTLEVAMHHRKSNTGRLEPPVGFKVTFDEGGIDIGRQGESAFVLEGSSTSARMWSLLASGAMTIQAIASELGLSESAIRGAFMRGKGTKFGEGVFGGQRCIARLSQQVPLRVVE